MDQPQELLGDLQSQSTWRLAGLGVITQGVYFGHFILGRTETLNSYLPADRHISGSIVWSILVLGYLNLLLLLADFVSELSEAMELFSQFTDFTWAACNITWGFMARSRMHLILAAKKDDDFWFNSLATLCFTPLYFNYKINALLELSAQPTETNMLCPECGLSYEPADYRAEAVHWNCSRCSAELPRPNA